MSFSGACALSANAEFRWMSRTSVPSCLLLLACPSKTDAVVRSVSLSEGAAGLFRFRPAECCAHSTAVAITTNTLPLFLYSEQFLSTQSCQVYIFITIKLLQFTVFLQVFKIYHYHFTQLYKDIKLQRK